MDCIWLSEILLYGVLISRTKDRHSDIENHRSGDSVDDKLFDRCTRKELI